MPKKIILVLIVVAQFCCTSLWFAGNGVMIYLISDFALPQSALPHLTSAVQFGFIAGTLIFALFTIADRFSPSRVFFVCALSGALFNLLMGWENNTFESLLVFRMMTGFFLAGIYPVGMKIAADYYDKTLGKSLGFLVGALVLGTAFPHILNQWVAGFSYKSVLYITSAGAVLGGLLILGGIPDGPFRKKSQKLHLAAFLKVFKQPGFRSAAFGYFGHMWELYAFWTFLPVMLVMYTDFHPGIAISVPFWTFSVIAIGALACVVGGYLSSYFGSKIIASSALLLSGICCLLSPFFFYQGSTTIFLTFLLFWGMVVIADSPMFSTLVAHNAPADVKGTALTIVNCIGFSITILSIQLLGWIQQVMPSNIAFILLAFGPAFGLYALSRPISKYVEGDVLSKERIIPSRNIPPYKSK
jgi:MFS family permease